jgi:NDP-sugar pyrophosphorylase family protein
MKAVVLAAGLGSRLRPVTNFIPKPLMPVFGVPIIELNILQLRDQGIREFLVNLHHMPRQIIQHLRDGSHLGVEISYSLEPTILGTGGAIKKLEARLRGSTFLVVNSDTYRPLCLEEFLAHHRRSAKPVTLLLQENPQLEPEKSIAVDPKGVVVGFLDMFAQETQEQSRPCDFLGVQLMEPEVLCMIPPDLPWEIHRLYMRLLESGRGIGGHCQEGYWKDLGTLAAYRDIHVEALEGRGPVQVPGEQREKGIWLGRGTQLVSDAKLHPPVFLGSFARVESGACLGPHTVVGNGCVIGSGARVEGSILWDQVRIEPGAVVRNRLVGREFSQPLG